MLPLVLFPMCRDAHRIDLGVGVCVSETADPRDPIAVQRNISGEARCTGSIDHARIANDEIVGFAHVGFPKDH